MRKPRWQHLDLQGGPPAPAPVSPPEPAPVRRAGVPDSAPLPPPAAALRLAWGLYRLGEYGHAAEAVRAALRDDGSVAGGQRLLGLALGRTGDYQGAIPALAAASAADPADDLTAAALLSARLAAGEAPPPPPDAEGALGELAAAARWRRARIQAASQPLAAGRAFSQAGAAFAAHSSPTELPQRLAACYLAEAISFLLADQPGSAQQAFVRYRGLGSMPPATVEFARRLYALAEAAAALGIEERREALAPLAALLADVSLRVRFYDGTAPVAMTWQGLPG